MSIVAWRVGLDPDEVQRRRLVMRSPEWRTMDAWLLRTRRARRKYPHNLWVEDEYQPAVTLAKRPRRRRRHH